MPASLSACLIVKNEAAHLPRCLASVRELVDEMVVVDTGSTDETPAIATAYGARVLAFAWRDDFSAARNFGLGQARGEWLLVLDADEALEPTHLLAQRRLGDADALGGAAEVQLLGDGDEVAQVPEVHIHKFII